MHLRTEIEADRYKNTLATSVYGQLRHDLLNGLFEPESKLRVERVIADYRCGASPVREALNRLAAEGLLDRHDQRGFSIRSVSAKELEELTRTRCWLEERALSESITNRTTAWEERLVLALHKLRRSSRQVQEKPSSRDPEWEKVHFEFHQALISACRSNWLITFCNQIADQMHRYRVLTISEDAKRDCMEEHRLIAEAALDGDIVNAVAALIAHYKKSADLCQEKLR